MRRFVVVVMWRHFCKDVGEGEMCGCERMAKMMLLMLFGVEVEGCYSGIDGG